MIPHTVLIADSDPSFRRALYNSIRTLGNISVNCSACNGLQALRMIAWHHPQTVVFSMSLPEMDGFMLLENLRLQYPTIHPRTIAIFDTLQPDLVDRARALGADACLQRSSAPQELPRCLQIPRDDPLATQPRPISSAPTAIPAESSLVPMVSRYLLQRGVPAHLLGYHFLVSAVTIELCTPGAIRNVGSHIYPQVAHTHGTTASCVERSIRHAINVAWSNISGDRSSGQLRHASFLTHKPTNTEVIALLAEQIRLRR